MNMNKNVTSEKLKITITEEGLKVNKDITLSEVTNMVLQSLLAGYVAKTNEENREQLFAMLSLAFSNCLAYYAPDLYFPSEEEMEQEAEQMAKLAELYPDITDKIEEAKAVVKTHIKEEDAFQPGESIAFDETGRAYFPVED